MKIIQKSKKSIYKFAPPMTRIPLSTVLTGHGLQRGGGVPVLPRRPRALRPLLVGGRGQVPPPAPIRGEHRGHVTRSPPITAHLGGQAGALLAGGWRSGGASQG